MDKEELRDAADIFVVAEALGITVKTVGRRHQILCPAHDDRNYGSCFLSERGFYCYSCGARGDVYDLVRKTLGISFEDSVKWVASLFGEDMNPYAGSRTFCISRADAEFIGLSCDAVYTDIAFLDDIEDEGDLPQGSSYAAEYGADDAFLGYRVRRLVTSNPLRDLCKDDPITYHKLIDDACEETIQKYLTLDKLFKEESCPYINLYSFIATLKKYVSPYDFHQICIQNAERAQNISVKHGYGRVVLDHKDTPLSASKISDSINRQWRMDKTAPF